MGKTVSLIHLWEGLLKNKDVYGTLPLFLTLHEYNLRSEDERSNFIAKRIAWHYLGLKDSSTEAIELIWAAFKATTENGSPDIVLLLDGFLSL